MAKKRTFSDIPQEALENFKAAIGGTVVREFQQPDGDFTVEVEFPD